MAQDITQFRVFIASPGGLELDRDAVRQVVAEFSDSVCSADGIQFAAIGWEDLPSSVGRPQETINALLKEADFFLLLLHDRWGSPTTPEGTSGPSSGCEEEFVLARQLHLDADRPMSDVAVFFKGVPHAQLADPGPQLSKVLEFRQRLTASKEVLFVEYNDAKPLEQVLRKQLGAWFRVAKRDFKDRARGAAPATGPEILAGQLAAPKSRSSSAVIDEHTAPFNVDTELLTAAITRVQALANSGSPRLRRAVRAAWERDLAPLQQVLQSLVPKEADPLLKAELLAEVAAVAEASGDNEVSESAWRDVLVLLPGDPRASLQVGAMLLDKDEYFEARSILELGYERVDANDSLAPILAGGLGNAQSGLGNHSVAVELYKEAIAKAGQHDSPYLLARLKWSLGNAYQEVQDYVAAEQVVSEAIELATEHGFASVLPNMYGALAIVLIKLNRDEEAEPWLMRSIAMFRKHGDKLGGMRGLVNVAFLHLYRGEPVEALEVLDECEPRLAKDAGRLGLAVARANRGLALWQLGRLTLARDSLSESLRKFEDSKVPHRAARVRSWLVAVERGDAPPGRDAMW